MNLSQLVEYVGGTHRIKRGRRRFSLCLHRRTTFPQSPRKGAAPQVTCLDCGRSFHYDWSHMRRGNEVQQ